jgi:hypothetical protein
VNTYKNNEVYNKHKRSKKQNQDPVYSRVLVADPPGKEKITKVVMSQPEDATYDEIMRELAFTRMVDRGLEDVRSGRVISNNEMANRIRAWQK